MQGTFLFIILMAKKVSQKWEANFYQKELVFLHLAKNYSVRYILNKKLGFFIFHILVESFSKNFIKKNRQKIDTKLS